MAQHDPYQRSLEHIRADDAARKRYLTDIERGRPGREAFAEYQAALQENFRTFDQTNWRRVEKIRTGRNEKPVSPEELEAARAKLFVDEVKT